MGNRIDRHRTSPYATPSVAPTRGRAAKRTQTDTYTAATGRRRAALEASRRAADPTHPGVAQTKRRRSQLDAPAVPSDVGEARWGALLDTAENELAVLPRRSARQEARAVGVAAQGESVGQFVATAGHVRQAFGGIKRAVQFGRGQDLWETLKAMDGGSVSSHEREKTFFDHVARYVQVPTAGDVTLTAAVAALGRMHMPGDFAE